MEKFEYNNEQARESNYDRWKRMNNRERFQYNERPYTNEQAVKIFDKLYPDVNLENGITLTDEWRKGTLWEKMDE
jgi:hypothetical protein|tara:strand:- start:527 stop:751 length:225 start_codon:yes stop_codon:yes gene_type:complete